MAQRNTPSLSTMGLLVILAICGVMVQVADATMVYLSTAKMDLAIRTTWMFDAKGLFDLENIANAYLKNVLGTDVAILHLNVAVRNQFKEGDGSVVETKVSLIYLANDGALKLPSLLQEKTNNDALAAALKVSTLNVAYGEEAETEEVREAPESSPDTGLLATSIALSFTLILLASVMLYVTGGWSACRHCCVNIFFEEVPEESDPHDVIKNHGTFQEQPEFDEESRSIAESSVAGTAASGILGAISNDENTNPAFGLGIKTPMGDQSNITGSEFDDESDIGDLGDTPYSQTPERSTSTLPLGITSIRKLIPDTPDTNAEDASKCSRDDMQSHLSQMIMGRFDPGKK